jgi:O-antigen/teichoic acid export membrane protein
MLGYGSYNILNQLGGLLITRIDVFMIPIFLGLKEAAIYSVGWMIVNAAHMPNMNLRQIATSRLNHHMDAGDMKEAELLSRKMTLNMVLSITTVGGVIAITIEDFLAVMPKANVYREANVVVWILLGAMFFQALRGIQDLVLVLSKDYRWGFGLQVLSGILNVLLNILLAPWLGLAGVALATLVSFAFRMVITTFYVHRRMGFHQFSSPILLVATLGFAFASAVYLIPLSGEGIWETGLVILSKAALFTAAHLGAMLYFRVSPELNKLLADAIWRLKQMR